MLVFLFELVYDLRLGLVLRVVFRGVGGVRGIERLRVVGRLESHFVELDDVLLIFDVVL